MLRTAIKGLLMAALLPALASADKVPPTVEQGWAGPFDFSSAVQDQEVQVWGEATGAIAWHVGGESRTLIDQWGATHTGVGCSVDSVTQLGCEWVDYFTTSRPDQHGITADGEPDTTWKGSDNLVGSAAAMATVTNVVRSGAPGTTTFGDQVEITISTSEYEEWVTGSLMPVPQSMYPCWGTDTTCTDPQQMTNPAWTDFVITMEYVQDAGALVGSGLGTDGWAVRYGDFTAYFTRASDDGPNDTTMHTEISHFKNVADGGVVDLPFSAKSNWGNAMWWRPGYFSVPKFIAGNSFWEACKLNGVGGVCVKDEPELYNTETGYIRVGDNVYAGSFGISLSSFGAFGELSFGLVPEPSAYVLQFVALISIGVLRLKKG